MIQQLNTYNKINEFATHIQQLMYILFIKKYGILIFIIIKYKKQDNFIENENNI